MLRDTVEILPTIVIPVKVVAKPAPYIPGKLYERKEQPEPTKLTEMMIAWGQQYKFAVDHPEDLLGLSLRNIITTTVDGGLEDANLAIDALYEAFKYDSANRLTRPLNYSDVISPNISLVNTITSVSFLSCFGDRLHRLNLHTNTLLESIGSMGVTLSRIVKRLFLNAGCTPSPGDVSKVVNLIRNYKPGTPLVKAWALDYYDVVYDSVSVLIHNLMSTAYDNALTFGRHCDRSEKDSKITLISLYLTQYSNWSKYPRFKTPEGDTYHLHLHRLLATMDDPDGYQLPLDWKVHPSIQFSEVALRAYRSDCATIRPEEYRIDKSFILEGVAELVAGSELLEEGIAMDHCVGGSGYVNRLASPMQHILSIGVGQPPEKRITVQLNNLSLLDNLSLHGGTETTPKSYRIVQRQGIGNSPVDDKHPAWELFVVQMLKLGIEYDHIVAPTQYDIGGELFGHTDSNAVEAVIPCEPIRHQLEWNPRYYRAEYTLPVRGS